MPKHPTSSRVPRPQPEPDDKFILAVSTAAVWARENRQKIIISTVVLGFAIVASLYYVQSQRRVEAEASLRLTEIHQTVMTGNVPLAIRDVQAYLATFGGTRAAREARLILADLLIGQQRPAEAIDALGRLPRNIDDPVGLAAAQLLAAAQEALQQRDEAIATYRRIGREARFEFQRRDALANAARVAIEAGQPDLAIELYDRLIQTFEEGNPQRSYFEMWRAEARELALAGDVAPAGTPAATPTPAEPVEPDPETNEDPQA
jgi:predicted negative regulator of RcsB-dependent stress response